MKDFFVSYNRQDRPWAEWIAWQLEAGGFSVVIQAWDFTGNWILAMDRAMQGAERTLVVLSQHYVDALYTQSEWAESFRRDPTGVHDLLVPVIVEEVNLTGLLAQIVYVDLVGIDAEDEAKRLLLARANRQRGKPSSQPVFPGAASRTDQASTPRPPYLASDETFRHERQTTLRAELPVTLGARPGHRDRELRYLQRLLESFSDHETVYAPIEASQRSTPGAPWAVETAVPRGFRSS